MDVLSAGPAVAVRTPGAPATVNGASDAGPSPAGGRRRIAIVGTGVSGLVAAHLLHRRHELTLFEAAGHVGGHTLTSDLELGGRTWAVDAGFVVYNETTYPLFVRLLDRLGVETRPTGMSFSVRCERTGLEYAGSSLDTLFAQRRNLFRPSFHRMLVDIVRFNRRARRLARSGDPGPTLRSFLEAGGYSRGFIDHYLVPMGAAIWSTRPDAMLDFPAGFFLRFLANHGLLSVDGHFTWRVIRGGSRRYVEALVQPFRDRIRLRTPVRRIRRRPDRVEISPAGGPAEAFDEVVIATHSDQALGLLADPDRAEREILGAIPYQVNEALLHTDASQLPRNPRARASWNYHVPRRKRDAVSVTYDMSRLQGLDTPVPVCVSLNRSESVDPAAVHRRFTFHHPLFTPAAVAAQRRHAEISGRRRTHYCGAYWGSGFHEDGVRSAVAVAERFGVTL